MATLNTQPTTPEGHPIEVRPIRQDELDRIPLRCLPETDVLGRVFRDQGTIGMAAWDEDICVGQLHCYRLGDTADCWPEWNRPWWLDRVLAGEFSFDRPIWCHACYHVGRTLDSSANERGMGIRKGIDTHYLGRGIGTALCKRSVRWAIEHGYRAVLGSGCPDGMFSFAIWSGGLPWPTYKKLGFTEVATEIDGEDLPDWAQGNSPPEVMKEVHSALVRGRPAKELQSRLMVFNALANGAGSRAAR